jgi:hypothetical protein
MIRCEDFARIAPELALGLLSGPERAAALEHLQDCAACRAQVDELSQTVDELLTAGPRAEPPAGFEGAVLDRFAAEWQQPSAELDQVASSDAGGAGDAGAPGFAAEGSPAAHSEPVGAPSATGESGLAPVGSVRPLAVSRRRRVARTSRRPVQIAVAGIAAVLLAVAGIFIGRSLTGSSPAVRSAAMVTAAGDHVGSVQLGRNPDTLFVAVPGWAPWGEAGGTNYRIRVTFSNGTSTELGPVQLSPGRVTWGTVTPFDTAQVRSVAMVEEGGHVFCSAHIA